MEGGLQVSDVANATVCGGRVVYLKEKQREALCMNWFVIVVLVLVLGGVAWLVGKLNEGQSAPVSCIHCGKCVAAGECVYVKERKCGKKTEST